VSEECKQKEATATCLRLLADLAVGAKHYAELRKRWTAPQLRRALCDGIGPREA
jgi:hypothetical protein